MPSGASLLPQGQISVGTTALISPQGLIPVSITSPPASGEVWAVPTIYSPTEFPLQAAAPEGLYIDLFELNVGGTTGPGLLSQQVYQWSSSAEGLTMASGSNSWTYTPVSSNGDLYLGLVTYRVNGTVIFRSAQWVTEANSNVPSLSDDLVQSNPLYWASGLGKTYAAHYLSDGRLDPAHVFGYQFLDSTQMTRLYGDGAEVPSIIREPDIWLWSTVNFTVVLERQNPYSQRHRRWDILKYMPGGRAVLLERDFAKSDPDPWRVLIGPRLNTIQLMDLTTWPEAYDPANF